MKKPALGRFLNYLISSKLYISEDATFNLVASSNQPLSMNVSRLHKYLYG